MASELMGRPQRRATNLGGQASDEISPSSDSADRMEELLKQVAAEHTSCQQEVISLRQQLAAMCGHWDREVHSTGEHAIGVSAGGEEPMRDTTSACVAQPSWAHSRTINLMWPTDLPVRDRLQADQVGHEGTESFSFRGRRSSFQYVTRMASYEQGERGVLHPDGKFCISCDLLGVLLAAYELMLIPVVLAWKFALKGVWLIVSWATFSFWLFDLALAFNKGTYVGGQISLRRSVIAVQYLKRGFAVDVLLLFVDLISNLLDTTGTQSILTFVGACRALKIVRILRVFRVIQKMLFWSIGMGARVAIQATLIALCAAMACHIMCCCWWAIGVHGPTDTGYRWADTYRDEYMVQGFSYEYTMSLHWIVGQMTLGGTDIATKNSMERTLNIIALVLALVLGSTLISLMSAGILDLRKSRQSKASSLLCLREFLRQESIPVGLAAEVQRQVQARHEERMLYHEEQVDAIAHLSRSTRMKLICAIRVPVLSTHDFWRMWASIDPGAMRALCLDVVDFRYVQSEDELFLAGERSFAALYIADGEHLYTQTPSTSMVDEVVSMPVVGETWVCEASLWSEWVTVGKIAAVARSKVFSMHAAKLWILVKEAPSVRKISITYAQNFHKQLTMAMPPLEDYPTDLYVPRTSVADLLSPQVEIDLLKSIKVRDMSHEQEFALIRELEEEKCCVTLDKTNRLLRTVLMAVLVLERYDGRRLVEIGRREGGTGAPASGDLKVYCRLPGTKRRRGESPALAIQRLLKEEMGGLAPLIRLAAVRSETQQTFSSKYGCETVYHKMVQEAILDGAVSEDEKSVMTFRLDTDKQGMPWGLGCLGNIKAQEVLMMRNQFTVPVFFSWFTPDEFDALCQNEEHFKPALKAWLEVQFTAL